jgi:hypothetical protein
MNDTISLALIIAAALVIALLILRKRLTKLRFRYRDIEAQLAAHNSQPTSSGGILVTRNRQVGTNNAIEVSNTQGDVSRNQQQGTSNKLRVDKPS